MGEKRVLVVDDELMVRDVLSRYLLREGFAVDLAEDGERALAVFTANPPDLVLLDLMLPRIDGLEVFRRIRAAAATPVIMLTARGEVTDRIVGLEVGADDYVTKPFSPREVVARVRAVLRRASSERVPAETGEIVHGDLRIDLRRHEVSVRGRPVRLTRKEFDLLAALASAPGTTFSRSRLLGGRLGLRLAWGRRDSHRPRPPSSREDRRRSLASAPSGDGVGRRLPLRPMRALRPLGLLVAVAGAGFAGTIAAGAAAGLHRGSLAHLAALILPALAVTVLATGIARAALGRASIRVSMTAVAAVGAAVGLANLAALAMLMIVGRPDATLVGVLLIYAAAAGVGAALALGSAQARAIGQLGSVARDLGKGTLSARAGTLEAGPELEMLAQTLDDMAGRLQDALSRERTMEARRRDLMTAISHDLRTPLSSLRAMVEAVDDGVVTDPPSLRRYAAEMRRSVIQLATMVDDLFELAQLEAGVVEAETQRIRLEDVVLSAIAAVQFQAAEKHLALQADLGGHGDTACSPRLARVLQNLLANAVRHTPADGTVLIEASRWQTGLELAVEDTGTGIDPEDLSRIFEPFYRADPARAGAGAGLGLALAKRIAEALGGCLEVQNKPPAGARFAIRIPPPAAANRSMQSG